MPSLGVSGDTAFLVRGAASFPVDVIDIDALHAAGIPSWPGASYFIEVKNNIGHGELRA